MLLLIFIASRKVKQMTVEMERVATRSDKTVSHVFTLPNCKLAL
jgi:hypothetical protein